MGLKQSKQEDAKVFVLKSELLEIHILNIGCNIQKVMMKDAQGAVEDIVLGFDTPQEYLNPGPMFGATIGRTINRISDAKFELDGKTYQLAANDGPNSIHGGIKGFDKKYWNSKMIGDNKLEMSYVSKDMEEGYPGTLRVTLVYELSSDNKLYTTVTARTTKPTIINIGNHNYYNLKGHASQTKILDHQVKINAIQCCPTNEQLLPTGEIQNVKGTPYDFTEWTTVGKNIEKAGGYDLNFVINQDTKISAPGDDSIKLAAQVYDSASKRALDVYTNGPGVQLYTSNTLEATGKGGTQYGKYDGICFETQDFPNAINRPEFPPIILRPKEVYIHKMIHHYYLKTE